MKFHQLFAALALCSPLAISGCFISGDDDDCDTDCDDAREECTVSCDDDACVADCDSARDDCKVECD
jgi:hypothetical protein